MATFTWRDGASGSWFDSANWTSNQVPTTSDTAIIKSGMPQVFSGGEIIGERIQLGAGTSGGTVTLDATDATFAPLTSGTGTPKVVQNMFLTVTGGGSSAPVSATFLAHGTTTFEGELIDEPINGALTISAVAAGGERGDFTFLNATDKSFGLVTQESVLNLAGQEITNNAPIEVEGTLNLASGTTLAGSGLVTMDNGGHLNLSGTVSSGLAIDFVDGTGSVAIASGATVSAEFGFTGIAGGRIDLAGVTATSEVVSSGVLTLLSGGTAVAEFKVVNVNPKLEVVPPPPSTADFTVTSDGQGGTLITYTPQGPTILSASLPVPVVAPTGSLVSLSSMLGQSFGPGTVGFYQIKLISPTIQTNTPSDQKFWSSEVAPTWYVNGAPITGDYVVQPGDNVQFLVGNNIANPAEIQVQVTPTVTSDSGEYVNYSIWTVDPSVAAQVASAGALAGHPTSADVVAAAKALNATFPDVPNTNLCNMIANDVAAAAGATMPLPNISFDPSLNAQGGFWRIAYEGTSVPNPPQDWSSLVSAGDIIRMQWFHPTSPADESGHTTTALGQVFTSGGQEMIQFYDNDDSPSNLPGSIIGIHDDNYWNRTNPASITIYRLDPKQQYLISGTSQSEVIQGSVYNNLIVPGGGADTITAGGGNNEIQDTTANLAHITVTDFHQGDELDFTDLNSSGVTVERSGTQLLVSSGGTQVADITLPARLPPGEVFTVTSDGVSGTLIALSAATPITWANGSDGGWSDAANWSGGVVPGASDYAIVNVSGSYAVTVGSNTAVNALSIFNAAAELRVDGATFTAGTLSTLDDIDVLNGGTVDVLVDAAVTSAVSGSGTIELGGLRGTTVSLGGVVASGVTVDFAGAGGTLQLKDSAEFHGTIDGFAPGDRIALADIPFDSTTSVSLQPGNVLEITFGGSNSATLQLDPSQSFAGEAFHVSALNGGTVVTEDSTPCYCLGTLIATVRGEVPVENLTISDHVLTAEGTARPIRWIGRRSYAGRFARGSHVLPICIKAGALDVGQPRRDLWVSPHHAMFLEGVLIEAIDLVNGMSIIQAERVERVDYCHIELDTHDVIIAEGAPSESFVDDDSRRIFQNAHEFAALYPDTPQTLARYCAPRRAFGPEVEAARRRIARRAGLSYAAPRRAEQPRALVVDSRFPQVGHDGGSNAILDHVRALQAAGFVVKFHALSGSSFNAFARAHAGAFDLVYLHREETATRCLKPARQYFDAQIVYSIADLHHLRLKAQSRFDQEHSAELIQEAQGVALRELAAAFEADCVITHSVSEATQLEQLETIAQARKVRVVPWTVPVAPVQTRFARRSGVAFVGHFSHAPNRDAARWLVNEIMPLVWREAPELQCLIVGSNLPAELSRELTRPQVAVLGRVERLSDLFERIRLTVAPLRFGAGLKDKVLRSMAAGLPCFGTAEAFSGMPELPAEIVSMCQRETAPDLAAAIVAMHRHEEVNAHCANLGLNYVAEFYNRARVDALMRELVEPALARYRARTPSGPECKVLQFGYDNPARRIAAT
ncbi:MAG: Hint domain-containing protein [Xanthobacteraceae bacterium]|nr:Hint domain-containing protein [Xanthobacteraceae bacterium]